MNDPRATKFKAVVAAINQVLYNDWAPIGLAGALPKDEYEFYAIRIVSMLAAGAQENELANYLAQTASSITGNPFSPENCLSVAIKMYLAFVRQPMPLPSRTPFKVAPAFGLRWMSRERAVWNT